MLCGCISDKPLEEAVATALMTSKTFADRVDAVLVTVVVETAAAEVVEMDDCAVEVDEDEVDAALPASS